MNALSVSNVSVSFDGLQALSGVSMECRPGEIVGLVGGNGCGKTTLFNVICGLQRPDAGEVRLGSRRVDRLAPWHIARLGVGRTFQGARPFAGLTVMDNLLVAHPCQPGENPLRALLQPRRVATVEAANSALAAHWLDYVGLSQQSEQAVESLSYGEQKLLAIAQLLMTGSQTLLLDEPTAGISRPMVPRILEVLRRLRFDGRAIVLIEHDWALVADLADRVYLLNEGRVANQVRPEELHHQAQASRALMAAGALA